MSLKSYGFFHSMFIEIISKVADLPDGQVLEGVDYGLLLNVSGVETPVYIKDLTNVQLDNEDMQEAKILYVTYREQDYQFDLPKQDSRDWAILEEMFHPE